MSIEARKLNLIEQLMHVSNETTLQRVQEILKEERLRAYKDNLQPMSTEELEKKLQQSEQDVQEGKIYSTDEVRKHFGNKGSNG